MSHLDSIARRVFQPEEYRQLSKLGGEERLAAFLRCWTRREAYVKALGAGLMETQPPSADWSVIDLDAGPDYAGAVAIRGGNWTVLSRPG